MALNERLSGPEIEAIRQAFARFRSLAATARNEADRVRIRAFCRQLTSAGPAAHILSEREVDVLAYAAIGLHNREIAEILLLTPETVKSYLRSCLARLSAHGRHEAVVTARRMGLLP